MKEETSSPHFSTNFQIDKQAKLWDETIKQNKGFLDIEKLENLSIYMIELNKVIQKIKQK